MQMMLMVKQNLEQTWSVWAKWFKELQQMISLPKSLRSMLNLKHSLNSRRGHGSNG
jgi:hypothetical protein